VDLGLTAFAAVSDGTMVRLSQFLPRAKRALRRKQKSSHRRRKAILAADYLHLKVRNRRRDFYQRLSTTLMRTKSVVAMEDFAGKGMVRSRPLARAIADAGWGDLRRMLEYKVSSCGLRVIMAKRFYPSSKTYLAFGAVKESLSLSERVFGCAACGLVMDRDRNAAIDLEHLARAGECFFAGSFPERKSYSER
jgi:putative transposase